MSRFYTNFTMHMGRVLLREVDGGFHKNLRIKCRPYLFFPDPGGEYRTVTGKPVRRIDFDSTTEARDFAEGLRGTHGAEVYGSTSWAYPFINDRYPGDVEFDASQICVAYIDIEVKSDAGFPEPSDAKHPITSIAMSVGGKMYVFSTVEYTPAEGVVYRKCVDEARLLNAFLEVWTSYPIDVMVGWNIDFFDGPYIVNRLARILGEENMKRLSPWNIVTKRMTFHNGKDVETVNIVGISIIDYMRAYQKFAHKPQESYSLNFISQVELGEKKIDYSEYGGLNQLYEKNPQLFIEYNIQDVRLMERLDAELGYLDLIYTISYYSKINFADAFGTVKMWEAMIHNELMTNKIVVPQKKNVTKMPFEGGYVKDVHVGKHQWIASFDFDSLYPHLIMALNISPETLQEQVIPSMSVGQILAGGFDEHRDKIGPFAVTGSCHLYSRDKQGFFPKLMEKLYSQRQANRAKAKELSKRIKTENLAPELKKKLETEESRLHNLQLAMKYALNSGYGAMSNEHFAWFDMRMAESVTLSGQVAVQWVARRINEWLSKCCGELKDYIVAIDTDSAYVNLGPLVKKIYGTESPDSSMVTEMVVKICEERLLGVISAASVEWGKYHNAFALDKLRMKREKVAEHAIWTAKKKYALWVRDDEGARLVDPELYVKGMEVVKSSTPAICREWMREAIEIILTKDEKTLQEFVYEKKRDFVTRPFEEIAAPRGVNGIHSYMDHNGNYTTGVPFHTRGAIVYNKLVKEKNLDRQYKKIEDGDKIKFSYMKMPNPTGENVLSCPGPLPIEFGLDPYVDYELQFEKVFLQPIRLLLNTINWTDRPQSTLASFFA